MIRPCVWSLWAKEAGMLLRWSWSYFLSLLIWDLNGPSLSLSLSLRLAWTICLLLSLTSASLFSGLSASFVVSQVDACAVSCCPLVLLCPQVTDRPPFSHSLLMGMSSRSLFMMLISSFCSCCIWPVSLWMNDFEGHDYRFCLLTFIQKCSLRRAVLQQKNILWLGT